MHAGRALGDRDRLQLLGHADRLRALGDERDLVARAHQHGRPVAVVVVRAPSTRRARGGRRSTRRAAGRSSGSARSVARQSLVAGDDLERAVLVLEVQLAQQLGMGAVVRAGALEVEADEARPPAVADDRRQHVVALAHQLRDVVRRVLDPRAVVGPAGRQHGVADAGAVEVQLVDAARRRVEHRPPDAAPSRTAAAGTAAGPQRWSMMSSHDLRLAAGDRDAGVLARVAPDPLRAPLAQTGAEARRLAPRRTRRRPRPRPARSTSSRSPRQRLPRVDDVDRARGLHPAAVPEDGVAGGHDHPVRALALAALGRLQRPAQPRGRLVQARHVPPVLAAQGDGAHHDLLAFPRVESRTRSSGTKAMPWCSCPSSMVSAISSSVAVRPSRSRGWRTEVRGTAAAVAKSMSS